jgi:hypothetical protein
LIQCVRFASMMIVFAVVGCAPAPLKPEDIAHINRVGVVSLVGNRLVRQHVDLAFSAGIDRIDISNWGIDQHVEEIAIRTIETQGKMSAVSLAADRPDLFNIYGPRALSEAGSYPNLKRVRDELVAIGAREHIDAFVLVVEQSPKGFPQREQIQGLSFFSRSDPFLAGDVRLFLLADVWVVDARSITRLAWHNVSMDYSEESAGTMLRCKQAQRSLSQEDLGALKPLVFEIVDTAIPVTVKGVLNPGSVPYGGVHLNPAWWNCAGRWDTREKSNK